MLNDAKIRAAKAGPKAYKLADAHQLYLYVSPQGAKLWRMKFKMARYPSGAFRLRA